MSLICAICVICGCSSASAALSANTVWEVRPSGVNTNGGGFVTGTTGTDWSQQDAAQYSVTDGVTAGTTTITSLTANFGTDVVGNIIYVQGGTGVVVAGWYQITARVSATTITVDRLTGLTAGTGVTLKIGGALLSPAIAAASAVTGNIVYIYNAGSSIYSITTASTNVDNGCMTNASACDFIGYSSTRSPATTDTPPTIQLNVSTGTMFAGAIHVTNLILDGNNQTTSKASTSAGLLYRCALKNFTGAAAVTGSAFFCTATTCTNTVFTGSAIFCEAYANTATPFNPTTNLAVCSHNISRDNTGATTDGFALGHRSLIADSLVSVRNGRDGYRFTAQATLMNSIAEGNTGWGANNAQNLGKLINFAHYNNTLGGVTQSGGLTAMTLNLNPIAVTAGSVFVDAATNNFALNNTDSRGALLRAAGFPAAFPLGTTLSYHDIGAAQSQQTAAPQTARIYGQ